MSRHSTDSGRTAVRLLPELPVSRLATHEFSLERAPDAYAAVDATEPGLLHVALRYA